MIDDGHGMTQPYIFMSHSSHDRDFTTGLAERLQEAGLRCWVDVDDIPDGSTWMREIQKAVEGCGALLVVMSKDGRELEWVERETLLAMELRKPLFIARIDEDAAAAAPDQPAVQRLSHAARKRRSRS